MPVQRGSDLSFEARTINYQAAPISCYPPELRQRAAALAHRVSQRVGSKRVKIRRGSYSILDFAPPHGGVTAKIIIYKGGRTPELPEGIYILIGVASAQAEKVRTITCVPWRNTHYTYFRLGNDQDLDEMADFIAASASLGSAAADATATGLNPEPVCE
jgi:hypothetical protein